VPEVLSVAEVNKLIERRANTLTGEIARQLLAVKGVLGEIKETGYQYCFGVALRDLSGNIILIDIPKKLVANISSYQGKGVIVYGILKASVWNSSIRFSIDVTRIEPEIELNTELKEQEKFLSDLLTSARKQTKFFPDKESYTVSVIHSLSSQTKLDFERQLKGLEGIAIEYHPANILSSEHIVKTIRSARGDILVIIRGGGDDPEFEVFNDFSVLEAWLKHSAFKIAALGHTEHRTYLDVFSDYSADTPTEAGAFIKKKIEELRSLREYEKKLAEKDSEIKQLNEKLRELQKSSVLTTERANNEIKNAMGKIEEKEQEIKALIQELQATRYQKRLAFAIILLLIIAIILLIIRF